MALAEKKGTPTCRSAPDGTSRNKFQTRQIAPKSTIGNARPGPRTPAFGCNSGIAKATLHAAPALFALNYRIEAKRLPASNQIFAIPRRSDVSRVRRKTASRSPNASVGDPLAYFVVTNTLFVSSFRRKLHRRPMFGACRLHRLAGRDCPAALRNVDQIRNRPDRLRRTAGYPGLPLFCACPLLQSGASPRGHLQSDHVGRPIRGSGQSGGARRTLSIQSSPSRKDGAALTPRFPVRAIGAQTAKESTHWADGFVTQPRCQNGGPP
jgi:hypothetical protein